MTAVIAALRRIEPPRIGRVWLAILAILALLALLDPGEFRPTASRALASLAGTLPFIVFAVALVAWLKATGAEVLAARAFEGRESRMILLAALAGGLAPFCSCEVIPFIAAMLALGAPLSAVMAFWLASPLMDPAAFLVTAAALGLPFAAAKTAAAVAIGLAGGAAVRAATAAGLFAGPLRARTGCGGCCAPAPSGAPEWRFWREPERRRVFAAEAGANGAFLLKWLAFAYLLQALMTTYIPDGLVAGLVGGPGLGPILVSALVGAPAYLNGYAAPALVAGFIGQGMTPAAGLAFMIAGGVTCIPAMTAVFALVRPPVFAAYLALGFLGAVLSGALFALAA